MIHQIVSFNHPDQLDEPTGSRIGSLEGLYFPYLFLLPRTQTTINEC